MRKIFGFGFNQYYINNEKKAGKYKKLNNSWICEEK